MNFITQLQLTACFFSMLLENFVFTHDILLSTPLPVTNNTKMNSIKPTPDQAWIDLLIASSTPVASKVTKITYEKWISMQRASFSALNSESQNRLISRIVNARCKILKSAGIELKHNLVKMDSIQVELAPIDHLARTMSIQMQAGKKLEGYSVSSIKKSLARLEEFSRTLSSIPAGVTPDLRELISESTLELQYILADGKGPLSRRLGKLHRRK